jgi:hypothetical protein
MYLLRLLNTSTITHMATLFYYYHYCTTFAELRISLSRPTTILISTASNTTLLVSGGSPAWYRLYGHCDVAHVVCTMILHVFHCVSNVVPLRSER